MSTNHLEVRDIGKSFIRYRSELHRIASWFGLPYRIKEQTHVLEGISFHLGQGEAVGIVGQNGAGKSTLLKIITGTLQPSHGRVGVHGRIAAILELGMGFNPEFTGRSNAAHACGLMGIDQQTIQDLIPLIKDFTELGEYFDQPVRVYSSGMQMRLAFAVVTAVRPEILIVDEALAVGDSYFQHKSFSRIKEFQKQGTSLLIVSHDANAIQTLCNRAILLEQGKMLMDGEPSEVMDYYNALIADKEEGTIQIKRTDSGKAQTTSGTGEATVESISLLNAKGEVAEIINVGESVTLRVKVQVHQTVPELVLGYMIKDRLGQPIFGTNTHYLDSPLEEVKQGERITYSFTFSANLGVGSYSFSIALHKSESHLMGNYEWQDLALMFEVVNLNRGNFTGVAWVPPQFKIEQ